MLCRSIGMLCCRVGLTMFGSVSLSLSLSLPPSLPLSLSPAAHIIPRNPIMIYTALPQDDSLVTTFLCFWRSLKTGIFPIAIQILIGRLAWIRDAAPPWIVISSCLLEGALRIEARHTNRSCSLRRPQNTMRLVRAVVSSFTSADS